MITIIMSFLALGGVVRLASVFFSWIYEPQINPPVAVIKRQFGEIKKVEIGGRWLVVIPYFHTIEELPVTRFEASVKDLKVTTPDNISSILKVIAVYLRPVPSEDSIKKLLESGGIKGVSETIANIAEQETRQWCGTTGQKPETWQELRSSQDKLVDDLKNKLILACGGEAPQNENNSPLIKLNTYGVYLDNVTVGEIVLADKAIEEAKSLKGKEELERAGELAETETELTVAEIVSERLSISKKEAFDKMQNYKLIRSGHGGTYQLNLSDLSEIIKFAKKSVSIIGESGTTGAVGGPQ